MTRIVLIAITLLSGCTRTQPPSSTEPVKPPLRITQFYASPPAVPRGEKTLLCYGVEGATAVRVQPPVEKLGPALTRCFEVTPAANTSYTLTAEDGKGGSVSQSVVVTVGAAKPRMFDISINAKTVKPGQQVSFCFKAANANTVRGGPGRFLLKGNPAKDCLIDTPAKTTTYEITVANAQGLTDSASVTVQVLP